MLTTRSRPVTRRRLPLAYCWHVLFVSGMLLAGCDSLPAPPDPNVRYIAFGDSTTDGPADRQYVDFLPDLLGESADAFANEGESGETSEEGLARLRMIFATDQYPNATTFIYWESGNDLNEFIRTNDPLLLTSPVDPEFSRGDELATALDDAMANVAAAIAEARTNGLTVFVATYAPLAPGIERCDALPLDVLFPGQATNGNAYLDALNTQLVQIAATNGATLVDIAAIGDELRSDSANYENCNHLSEQGNERVAEEFSAAIRP
jgi:lysophospholipase L1-like esterase